MKKLGLRILFIMLLILATYGGVLFLPTKAYGIFAAAIAKQQRLTSIAEPKIVFVGGSSLAQGLDSELLQQRTGRPVVNMGINAGLGLRYMLAEVESAIKAGDIVVLSPEYENWYGSTLDGELNILWALHVRPSSITYLTSPQQLYTLIKYLPEFMQLKTKDFIASWSDPVYDRVSFNSFGDFTAHLNQPAPPALGGIHRINADSFNAETITVLAQFAKRVHNQKATLLYIYPPLAETQYQFEDNRIAINQIDEQLQQSAQVVVSGEPYDYVLPDSLFFDTVYHLNSAGRQTRTEKLANELNRVIALRK